MGGQYGCHETPIGNAKHIVILFVSFIIQASPTTHPIPETSLFRIHILCLINVMIPATKLTQFLWMFWSEFQRLIRLTSFSLHTNESLSDPIWSRYKFENAQFGFPSICIDQRRHFTSNNSLQYSGTISNWYNNGWQERSDCWCAQQNTRRIITFAFVYDQ